MAKRRRPMNTAKRPTPAVSQSNWEEILGDSYPWKKPGSQVSAATRSKRTIPRSRIALHQRLRILV
jgi:hypothetical protein